MSLGAVRFTSIDPGKSSLSPAHILSMCDRLQMPDTGLVLAEVVYLQTFRNGTNQQLVSKVMNVTSTLIDSELAVTTFATGSRPYPTPAESSTVRQCPHSGHGTLFVNPSPKPLHPPLTGYSTPS